MIGEGKSVQLLLTARLSVKQWDLWEGGLGIRGRCHRLLWITFMKASPPPSLSHPPKNLLPQQCCCRPLASQSRSLFQTEPAPAAMAEEERGGKFGKLCGSVSPFSQDIGDNPRNKIANKEARLLD